MSLQSGSDSKRAVRIEAEADFRRRFCAARRGRWRCWFLESMRAPFASERRHGQGVRRMFCICNNLEYCSNT